MGRNSTSQQLDTFIGTASAIAIAIGVAVAIAIPSTVIEIRRQFYSMLSVD